MTAHDAKPVVQRYHIRGSRYGDYEETPDDDGEWVKAIDYEALRAEVERLKNNADIGWEWAAKHKSNLDQAICRAEAAEGRVAEIRAAGRDYMIAKSLTSMPRKHEFARDRGLEIRGELGCEAVHEWMLAAHERLEAALNDQDQ